MSKEVTIFGKAGCPFTNRARAAFAEDGYNIEFLDVKVDSDNLDRMLLLSDGRKRVPVILEGEKVTIGFKGS